MEITITSGKGYGKTTISAFDAALKDAGIYNYNLLTMSSIIPPKSKIVLKKFKASVKEYGHKLYVVKSEIRTRESGKFIGAALGWYQLPDGRGIFVEHEEIGETKEAVEANIDDNIRKSLIDLCHFRGIRIVEKNMKMKTSIIEVKDSSASVLVIGAYKSEGWD